MRNFGALSSGVGGRKILKRGRSKRGRMQNYAIICQKAADVWKKDVWDFQGLSQTYLELAIFPRK